MLSKLEAVNKLDGFDHCYLTPEGARTIAEPFGIKLTMQRQTNNPDAFKGLSVPGARKGEKIEGYDAADLAVVLCETQRVEYTPMFGRGSRLHECCRALREHVTKVEAGASV